MTVFERQAVTQEWLYLQEWLLQRSHSCMIILEEPLLQVEPFLHDILEEPLLHDILEVPSCMIILEKPLLHDNTGGATPA